MGWSYVSPLSDSDGSGQDTPLCFLSMHLVFSYFIPQIKSQATPPLLSLYSNRGVKWEVNSWIWGNNSHMGLQIIMCFDWVFVIAIVIARVSWQISAVVGSFHDAFQMPPWCLWTIHPSTAHQQWQSEKQTSTHTRTHVVCSLKLKSRAYHLSNKIIFIHYNWLHSSTFH